MADSLTGAKYSGSRSLSPQPALHSEVPLSSPHAWRDASVSLATTALSSCSVSVAPSLVRRRSLSSTANVTHAAAPAAVSVRPLYAHPINAPSEVKRCDSQPLLCSRSSSIPPCDEAPRTSSRRSPVLCPRLSDVVEEKGEAARRTTPLSSSSSNKLSMTCRGSNRLEDVLHDIDTHVDDAGFIFQQEYLYYPSIEDANIAPGECGLQNGNEISPSLREVSPSSQAAPWTPCLAGDSPFVPRRLLASHPSQFSKSSSTALQDIRSAPREPLDVKAVVASVLSLTEETVSPLPSHRLTGRCEPSGEGQEVEVTGPLHISVEDVEEYDDAVERAALQQHIAETKARIARADHLLSRYDAVISSRTEQIAALTQQANDAAQQAADYHQREAVAMKDAQQMRERIFKHKKLSILTNMITEMNQRIETKQKQVETLQQRWDQLQELLTASLDGRTEGGDSGDEADERDGESDTPQEKSSSMKESDSQSISSVFSESREAISDFLDEMLSEVEALKRIYIQVPAPPQPPSPLRGGSDVGQLSSTAVMGSGFFSYFGGATEAHLGSITLSTFLTVVVQLSWAAWEMEEELRLRARELATEQEEEALKLQCQEPRHILRLSPLARKGNDGTPGNEQSTSVDLTEAISVPSRENATCKMKGHATPQDRSATPSVLSSPSGDSPTAVEMAMESTPQKLLFSSPERARQMTSPFSVSPLSLNKRASSSRASQAPVLLPILTYAYPRLPSVSHRLDVEKLHVQKQYEEAIEKDRENRRNLVSRFKDTYRNSVEPALKKIVQRLQQQQTSLVHQLAELGVTDLTIQWEEDELDDALNDDVILKTIESMTAVDSVLGHRQHRASRHSLSRASYSHCGARRHGEKEQGGQGMGCTSLPNESGHPPDPQRYLRTIRVRPAPHKAQDEPSRGSLGPVKAGKIPNSSSSRHTGRSDVGSARVIRTRPSSVLPSSPQSRTLSARRQGTSTTPVPTSARRRASITPVLQSNSLVKGTATHGNGGAAVKQRSGRMPSVTPRASTAASSSGRTTLGSARPQGSGGLQRRSDGSAKSARGLVVSPRGKNPQPAAAQPKADPPPRVVDRRYPIQDNQGSIGSGGSSGQSPFTSWLGPPHGGQVLGGKGNDQKTREAMEDGAIRVQIVFSGKEARRRQKLNAEKEAYQRAFWAQRAELARVDEDVFLIRSRVEELEETWRVTHEAQETKLKDAMAKRDSFREVYEALKVEYDDWTALQNSLEIGAHSSDT